MTGRPVEAPVPVLGLWGPTADCPQSLHVLKREISAGETVQSSFQF